MQAPLLRFTLADGRSATLLVGEASTVLSVDDALVSSWDLLGRPFALAREEGTYRRGLDGGLLLKREATSGRARVRRRLEAREGDAVVDTARAEATFALHALLARERDLTPGEGAREAIRRLRLVIAMDSAALGRDAELFRQVCGPVGILPPDQYLSLVVRVTEGCSWNACTFCSLYRNVPFRFKSPAELAAHVEALVAYFGPALALRRSVFLGDANALCLAQDRLLPLVERVSHALPGRPLASFVDAWSGARRTAREWRALAALGLRRVYVGLESGEPGLVAWLGKPGAPADAAALVSALHDAGVAVGVIVLLGAGGDRHSPAHVVATAALLSRMELGTDDLLYFSEYVEGPGSRYGASAAGAPDLQPLDAAGCTLQRRAILERTALPAGGRGPRMASYDVREFVY